MSQQREDLRFERKAYVDHINRHSLISLVLQHPALFRQIHQERVVNSMYFDTIHYSDAKEKIDGLNSRKKVRIRWYGNLFGEVAKPVLEIKNKENGLGWKDRHPLKPFVFEQNGGLFAPFEYRETQDVSVPKLLLTDRIPSLLISYQRIYFQSADGRFRITVDDQLKFYCPVRKNRCWIMLSGNTQGTILELKYSRADDSDARQITSWYPFRWGSFSKYTRGLESTNNL